MIAGKKILAFIPAKAHSRRVPGKNTKLLNGKPLLFWTIECAKKSKYIDEIVVSTDSEQIAELAKSYGASVPFLRPAEFATDTASGMEPVLHALTEVKGYDFLVELQVTSPFRSSDDVDGCIEYCMANNAKACISVAPLDIDPTWIYSRQSSGQLIPLMASEQKNESQQLF
ncbi:MAG: acylneuraminate cytidylyltransferase family protein, partial [Gammaproteobacteria bacterium]|nr:acylneuraminate cytidylyltransferase family protein [Gammaproteobacteria bacterium]